MGKRSNFARVERDFYPTPPKAVEPLLPHLKAGTVFIEPCAGDGALIDALEAHGNQCYASYDIEPQGRIVQKIDAMEARVCPSLSWDCFITNPPWNRKFLHPFIDKYRRIAPTWLLFDADWMCTKQAHPFLPYCHKIVSVGRVKWFPDSKWVGKDNVCWYLFDDFEDDTVFYPCNAKRHSPYVPHGH